VGIRGEVGRLKAETEGGGVRWAGLNPSSSWIEKDIFLKGEAGSGTGSSGGAREMEIWGIDRIAISDMLRKTEFERN
jgi:hypothetical protein